MRFLSLKFPAAKKLRRALPPVRGGRRGRDRARHPVAAPSGHDGHGQITLPPRWLVQACSTPSSQPLLICNGECCTTGISSVARWQSSVPVLDFPATPGAGAIAAAILAERPTGAYFRMSSAFETGILSRAASMTAFVNSDLWSTHLALKLLRHAVQKYSSK